MRTVQCMIHNCTFGYPEEMPNDRPMECPFCMQDERNKLLTELSTVSEQRNCLVKAIDIARTLSITSNTKGEAPK